jgi:8-oxo-dGTP pyrophosphatase MutT (NUDIX family)
MRDTVPHPWGGRRCSGFVTLTIYRTQMRWENVTEMDDTLRKRRGWMPTRLWNQVMKNMSIPCVDIILENRHGEVLFGWRRIEPYSNVWALPGGRLLKGEKLHSAAARILSEYALSASNFHLVGVFPINFPTRSDIAICLASRQFEGVATPDGFEFSNFQWANKLPERLGANYRRMIMRWRRLKQETRALRFAGL